MAKNEKRVRVAALVALLAGAAAAVAGSVWYFFPIELAELRSQYELRREGVREVRSGALAGYVQDYCDPKRPAEECRCVALIHGMADQALTFKKILAWPKNGWPTPVKVYAWDLPGSGKSAAPLQTADFRVRLQAAKLREAMAPLCSKWIVVGNSMGGWVAAWLALDWPQGVQRLVLSSPSGLEAGRKIPGASPEPLLTEPTIESMKEFQARAYFRARELPESVWREVVRRMKSNPAPVIQAAQTPEDFVDARIGTLRVPTMLLWGEADRIIPPAVGQLWRSKMPAAVWEPISECGHLPQKECPVDLIRGIVSMMRFGSV